MAAQAHSEEILKLRIEGTLFIGDRQAVEQLVFDVLDLFRADFQVTRYLDHT